MGKKGPRERGSMAVQCSRDAKGNGLIGLPCCTVRVSIGLVQEYPFLTIAMRYFLINAWVFESSFFRRGVGHEDRRSAGSTVPISETCDLSMFITQAKQHNVQPYVEVIFLLRILDSQRIVNWFYNQDTHDRSCIHPYGRVPCAHFSRSLS